MVETGLQAPHETFPHQTWLRGLYVMALSSLLREGLLRHCHDWHPAINGFNKGELAKEGCHLATNMWPKAEERPEMEDPRQPRAGQRRMLHGGRACAVTERHIEREVCLRCRFCHMWRVPHDGRPAREKFVRQPGASGCRR